MIATLLKKHLHSHRVAKPVEIKPDEIPYGDWKAVLESNDIWIGAFTLKTGVGRYSLLVLMDSVAYNQKDREASKKALSVINSMGCDVVLMGIACYKDNEATIVQEGWEMFWFRDFDKYEGGL